MTENSAKKQRGAPFRKGQSGNPSGKPKGTRNRTTVLAEKLMQDDAADIVQVVLAAAKGGDMTARGSFWTGFHQSGEAGLCIWSCHP
jgi:hypothetical protein